MCDPIFCSWGLGSPQRGPGQSPGGKRILSNLLKIKLKSGLFPVAVYTPNSDPDKLRSLVGTAQDRQCCPWLCKTY